ncbi:MAG: hypothetical protein AB8B85_09600 [Paracoccaceae bacterium]
MKSTSMVLMGLSISSGIGGTLLLAANLIVWAVLTFWVGSMLAFGGFLLIAWAVRPSRDEIDQELTALVETPEGKQTTNA